MPTTEAFGATTRGEDSDDLRDRVLQLEGKLAEQERKLDLHIREAQVIRDRVEKAADILDGVVEFLRNAARVSHEVKAFHEASQAQAGARVPEGVSETVRLRPSPAPHRSVTIKGSVTRSLVGLASVLIVGLGVPTRTLPSGVVPIFDVLVFLGIAGFGWAGLVAAFRERHRTLPSANSRQ